MSDYCQRSESGGGPSPERGTRRRRRWRRPSRDASDAPCALLGDGAASGRHVGLSAIRCAADGPAPGGAGSLDRQMHAIWRQRHLPLAVWLAVVQETCPLAVRMCIPLFLGDLKGLTGHGATHSPKKATNHFGWFSILNCISGVELVSGRRLGDLSGCLVSPTSPRAPSRAQC